MFDTPEQDEVALEIAMKALHEVLMALTVTQAYDIVKKALNTITEECDS
jgi:hypothetical protein